MKIYNFAFLTEEDFPTGAVPVARIQEFVPQDAETQNLYRLYIDTGMIPLRAAVRVLEARMGLHAREAR